MSGIFGLALLKGNKLGGNKLTTVVTELLRAQIGQTESASLVATSNNTIHVLQKDMTLARFISSPFYKSYMDRVINEDEVYSIIGGFRKQSSDFSATRKKGIITKKGNTVCVHKETNYNAEGNGELLTLLIDEALDVTGVPSFYGMAARGKREAKNVSMYATINALFPSVLVITKHTIDPLYISSFTDAGVVLFAPLREAVSKLGRELDLGREEEIEMFSNKSLVMCMKNNTCKTVNIFPGV